jgi:hypothetical protein
VVSHGPHFLGQAGNGGDLMDVVRSDSGIDLKRQTLFAQYGHPTGKAVKRTINPTKIIMFLGGWTIKANAQAGHPGGFYFSGQRGRQHSPVSRQQHSETKIRSQRGQFKNIPPDQGFPTAQDNHRLGAPFSQTP